MTAVAETFKIQIPRVTNDPERRALIYNRTRSKHFTMVCTPALDKLFPLGIDKIFVRAKLHSDGRFEVLKRYATDQGF